MASDDEGAFFHGVGAEIARTISGTGSGDQPGGEPTADGRLGANMSNLDDEMEVEEATEETLRELESRKSELGQRKSMIQARREQLSKEIASAKAEGAALEERNSMMMGEVQNLRRYSSMDVAEAVRRTSVLDTDDPELVKLRRITMTKFEQLQRLKEKHEQAREDAQSAPSEASGAASQRSSLRRSVPDGSKRGSGKSRRDSEVALEDFAKAAMQTIRRASASSGSANA